MSALEIIIALFGGIVAGTVFSILISKYIKPEFPGNTESPAVSYTHLRAHET